MLKKYYLKIYIAANNFSNVICFDNHYERDLYITDCKAYYKSGIYFSQWEISGSDALQEQVAIMQRQLQAGYDSQIADLQRRISKYKSQLSSKCDDCMYKLQADTLQASYDRLSQNLKLLQDSYEQAKQAGKQAQDAYINTIATLDKILTTKDDKYIDEQMDALQDTLPKVGGLLQVNARLALAYTLHLIASLKSG
jgi:uncharacterized phage infection (PIP) family protein YhgE